MMLIIFLSVFVRLFAPDDGCIMIFKSESVNYYEELIRAVTKVESNDGKYTWNEKEQAVGWFQIRPVRVRHYNALTGQKYTSNDFYDYDLSREMFLFYASGKSFERAAKDWNGSGPMTVTYWNKIKKHL
jgi:hypothetical protein